LKAYLIATAIFSVLVSLLVILLLLYATFPKEIPSKVIRIVTLLTLIAAIFSITLQHRALRLAKKEERKITLIECTNCGYKLERPFREGDYVLKTLGRCSCGGMLYVDSIYTEKK